MDTTSNVKRMNKEDRRRLIIEAAMKVFVENGFKGSTTLEIAKRAGISEVTLFRYFKSKQELFLQGIEPILLSTLKSSVNISGTESPKVKLENILFERISLISKNYQVVKLILSEELLLTGLGGSNFMSKIIEILETTLSQIGIAINDKNINLRLLMGSMLSFLYMPEKNDEIIREYVSKVASIILIENKKIEKD